jgi:hypothetical protein
MMRLWPKVKEPNNLAMLREIDAAHAPSSCWATAAQWCRTEQAEDHEH